MVVGVCVVGWYNREMIKAANAHGYTVALGDCYPFDVNIKNATVIRYPCVCGGPCRAVDSMVTVCPPHTPHHSRYIKWKVRDGSVIIVHDGRKERRFTIDVLKSVLPHLKEVPSSFFVLRFFFVFVLSSQPTAQFHNTI